MCEVPYHPYLEELMNKLMKSFALLGIALTAAMCPCDMSGISTAQAQEKINVRIVGAALGGAVNRSYAAFAAGFMKDYAGSNVDILPGGAVANPSRMQRGAGEISHTQTIPLKSAYSGTNIYKAKHDKLMSMFRIGDETRLHFIAREKAPFQSLDEIRDKKLAISLAMSPKGTTNELFGRWVLEAYGITYDDIRKWGGNVNFSAYDTVVNSMKDNQVDMLVWVGPGEPVFMQEVALGQKLRWMPVKEEVREKMKEKGLRPTIIKANEFNGMVGTDIPCLTDTNEIFTTADTPEELVYKMTKSWVEHHKEIGDANPGWACFDPAKACQQTTLTMHPGAVRYFREAGLLK